MGATELYSFHWICSNMSLLCMGTSLDKNTNNDLFQAVKGFPQLVFDEIHRLDITSLCVASSDYFVESF